ncbi:CLUMA_CG020331, isoform A [Clunio marinus]|uniref:CLUMA_CG020331, isoform A n=1 Tax=Clunio marinus TaxID=568069 RepID=A0A1J1J8T4_9DIPT|nr:CLUMA_CG020331, isoform A [Clunio marinus]
MISLSLIRILERSIVYKHFIALITLQRVLFLYVSAALTLEIFTFMSHKSETSKDLAFNF